MRKQAHVPSGWQVVHLGDVAEVNGCQWDPTESSPILYLDLNSIVAPGRLSGPKELAACNAPSRARRRVKTGDILVSTVRPYLRGFARVVEAPPNLIASTGFAVLAPRPEANGSFLYHHIMANPFVRHLEASMTGQAYPAVRPGDVLAYRFQIPPLSEQRAIAAVLDSIDEAIERTEAVVAAIERLRDALLHELLTRGVPGWHTEWKHAPGIGTIPACWDVKRLGEVAEVTFSSVDKKTASNELSVQLCNYTDVFYNRRIRPGMSFMAATATQTECERWSLRRNDVLFTKDSETPDEIGIPTHVAEDMPDVVCGYHLALARPHAHCADGAFLTEALRSSASRRQFSRIANGVTRFGLTLGATRSFSVGLPPLAEQQVIATLLDSADNAIERGHAEREGLQSLKSSAEEALLTGKVRAIASELRKGEA